jgi:hypothetical protein
MGVYLYTAFLCRVKLTVFDTVDHSIINNSSLKHRNI